MRNRLSIPILFLAAALPLSAQIRGAGSAGSGAAVTAGFGIRGGAAGSGHFHHGRAFSRGPLLYPYPYYYDSDFGYDAQSVAQPQVVVVPAAASAQPAPPAPPPEPLLIEWQGDHFERMTLSEKAAAKGQATPDYSERSGPRSSTIGVSGSETASRKAAGQTPPRELPPAVLVFRDGRTEEVTSYTIMSGTIYSKADYWTSGSWTRKIQIADLDVPATLKQNQERGLNFVLPSGPNEVVMRP